MFENFNLLTVLLLLLMMEVAALFHTLTFVKTFQLKKLPIWLFFVLDPLIVLLAYLINPDFTVPTAVGVFISVLVFGFLGAIGRVLIKFFKNIKDADKTKRSIVGLVIGAAFIATFIFMGPYMVPLIVVFVFFMLFYNSHSGLFYYQGILPTSKVKSMAMGLVELKGKVSCKNDYLESPISHKQCVGYTYEIEIKKTDSDGHSSYHREHFESQCQDFYITDDTGEVLVLADKIGMDSLYPGEITYSGGKRYTEHLLLPEEDVLLIGKAVDLSDKGVCVVREDVKKIFGLTPVSALNLKIKYQPVLNQLLLTTAIIAILIALILLLPIEITGDTLIIDMSKIHFLK